MATFKVIDVRRIPTPDETRIGQFDTVVTYKLSDLEVFMVRIPKDKVDETDVVKAVKEDLETKNRIVGKEFQL